MRPGHLICRHLIVEYCAVRLFRAVEIAACTNLLVLRFRFVKRYECCKRPRHPDRGCRGRPRSSQRRSSYSAPLPAFFLTTVLFSSGIGSGTSLPSISATASNFCGQTCKHVPHLMQLS